MLTEVDLENPDHALYPGMYADVTLELERHADTTSVPATAIAGSGTEPFVYVVRDGALAKVPVQTGLRSANQVEVTSGVSPDDAVVATVSPALVEGEEVRTAFATGSDARS